MTRLLTTLLGGGGGGGGGGVTDHGALTGLGDDDHAQYALADGSRGTFDVAGSVVKAVYRTIAVSGVASDGWYWGNSTTQAATFTGRTCSIIWEGTAAQIPAQGTGDSALQAGDHAVVRTATF